VQSDAQLTGNLSTLPSFWVMAVVLAWGIHWHWVGGLIASAAVSVADVAIRPEITQTNVGNIFLLMVGGPVIGYTTGLLKEMAGARDRAERAAAAAAERARLARVVHDGVLQVLSLVQRRGLELGGEAADLGRLAGEQEVALRALVQQGESSSFGLSGDLARSLSSLQSRTVTVSVPGSVVLFPSAVVEEVTAVVRACLSNVEVHVGPDAPAWVLLEDLGSSVIVTVRDEGPGIPSGRLEDAAAEGRLGVRESIRGRVADLGGTATLVTAPRQGTEWELTFPKA
jgi:signal transduction histidine kinase